MIRKPRKATNLPPWAAALLLLTSAILPALALADDDEGEGGGHGSEERSSDDHQRSNQSGKDHGKDRDDDHDQREKREKWEREDREVKVEIDDDDFEANSTRGSPTGRDDLRVKFNLETARLDLKLEGHDQDRAPETRLRADHWALLEFIDENHDGSFRTGERIVQQLRPETLHFRSLSRLAAPGGERIDAEYRLPANGTFVLSFFIPAEALNVSGLLVAPTEVKFDVHIDRFPFQASDSLVALRFSFKADAELEEGAKDGTPAIFSASEGVEGFLRWVNTSVVDGADRPVGIHVVEARFGEDKDSFKVSATVTFAYARGQQVLHDPSLGFSLATAGISILAHPLGDWRLVAVSLGAAAMLVAATMVPRLRFREK